MDALEVSAGARRPRPATPHPQLRHRHARPAVGMFVLAAVGLSVLLALAALQTRGAAEQLVLFTLAILAVTGVFFLFGAAVGLVQLGERVDGDDPLRAFAENSADAIELTAGGEIVFANAAMRALGAGATLEQVLAGEQRAAQAYFRLTRLAEQGRAGEETVALDHGRWLRVAVAPAGRRAEGPLSAWTVTDISAARRRDAAVTWQLEESRRHLDALPLGFFASTADGRIDRLNSTLAAWLDLPQAAGEGDGALRLTDIMLGDSAELLAGAESAGAGDVTGNGSDADAHGLQHLDVDLKRRDGSALPVRLLHRPLAPSAGPADRALTVVMSRTPADGIAEDARAAQVRFARLFHGAPFGVATIARDGRLVTANATFAKIFSRVRRGAPRTFERLLALTEDAAQREALSVALAAALDGRAIAGPIEVTIAGKHEASCRLYLCPSPDASADAGPDAAPGSAPDSVGAAAILYVVDTTEQKALEVKFAQSQKMEAVGQLAGGIAHDFNNVLTAIIGVSDLLLQNRRPTDPAFRDMTLIRDNAMRAAGLVRQLLAFSRRQTLQPEMLALNEVVDDHAIMLRRYISEKVQLKLVHGRDPWLVKADKTQLEQVLMNLAINARDAMPKGGTLAIRTRNVGEREAVKLASQVAGQIGGLGIEPGEYVLIEVEDTGTGMPPEVLGRIFEPFFSTKEVGKGTGLGLSTVYGIVKQTGGYVFADSTPAKGTTFRVYLPRYVPVAGVVEASARAAEKRERDRDRPRDLTGTGCVLLVEDEDAVRSFAKRALERQGYEVLEACTGTEALEIMGVEGDRVDIVVSDVVMPEMDGPTLLTNLRKTWPDIKVIFVSGYPDDAFRKSLAEGEQFEFLAKPFRLPQLAAKVKETLAA